MSNPQTFYKVGGVDLSNIFQPLTGTQSPITTGYKLPNGDDLNTIFEPYPGTGIKAPETSYNVTGLGDLNNIFNHLTGLKIFYRNNTFSNKSTSSGVNIVRLGDLFMIVNI